MTYFILMCSLQQYEINNIIAMKQQQKPPNTITQTPRMQPTLSADLRKLVDLWLDNSVDEFYQNKVMAYLDQFQNKEIQLRQIKKQIQLTLKKQTIFFMLRHLLQQKDQQVDALDKQIQTLQKQCNLNNQEEPDLEPVSNILNDLRQSHMFIVETLMQFLQKYKIKNNKSPQRQGSEEQSSILACISTDIAFLKDSVLKYYIPFGQQLDPLFVEQAKVLKKSYRQNKIVYNRHIEKLLTLIPSHMYRLLRAKKNIDKLILLESEKQDNYHQASEDIEEKQVEKSKEFIQQKSQRGTQQQISRNMQTIQQEKSVVQSQSQKIKQSKKIVLSFKLDNSAYLMDQHKTKSRAYTRNETIQVFEEQYKINTDLPQGISILSRNQPKTRPQTKSKNRTLKLQARQVEVSVQKDKHTPKLKLSPPVLKIDIRSEIRERKESSFKRNTLSPQFQQSNIMPKVQNNMICNEIRKFKDEGVQHSPTQIVSKNKRFYLLELQKDSRIIQQNSQPMCRKKKEQNIMSEEKLLPRRLQSIDSIHHKNKVRKQLESKYKRNKSISNENFESPMNQKKLNQLQCRETHKNFLNLFQKDNNRHINEPKYEQRYIEPEQKSQENKELTQEQEDYLERQKQLIAKINKKYKQLAMKEKEYELNKLGHNVYHRNREKVNNKQKITPTRKYKHNLAVT